MMPSSAIAIFFLLACSLCPRGCSFVPAAPKTLRSSQAAPLQISTFFGRSETDVSLKKQLVQAIEPTNRGVKESPEQRSQILKLVEKLEKKNRINNPLKSPYLNAKWTLLYTTSSQILGKDAPGAFKPAGKIYQTLDANKLQARNEDCFRPIPFLPTVMRAVTAELTPTSKSNVTVQFKQFEFGPFKVKAPESARGALDTTYLDSTFRISRGDKGNVFVLQKETEENL